MDSLVIDYLIRAGYGWEPYRYCTKTETINGTKYPVNGNYCVSTTVNYGDYEGLWELAVGMKDRFPSLFFPEFVSVINSHVRVYWKELNDQEDWPTEEAEHDFDDLDD